MREEIQSIYNFIETWSRQSVFVYQTILSLISAVIFFYFFEVLPKRRERNNVKDQIIHLTERILNHIMFIIQDTSNSNLSQTKIRSFELKKTEITAALSSVKMTDQLKHLRVNEQGQPMTVGEAVAMDIHQLQKDSEILFRYIFHLDTSLIKQVDKALRNIFVESWLNSYKRTPTFLGSIILQPAERVLSYYDEHLLDFNETYLNIQEWLYKNYSNHHDVLRRRLISEFHDKENWKSSLKITRRYKKITENKNEAICFEIKALWKLDALEKAKEIKRRGIASGQLTEDYFRAQTIYDPKFKDMHIQDIE